MNVWQRKFRSVFIVATILCPAVHSAAQNVWTNTSGGNWEDAWSWSYGAPSDSQSTYGAIITNAPGKTIVIGSNTWANYSNSLAYMSPLRLSAPDGYTNRLFIDATDAPIEFRSSSRCIDTNGILENLGATLALYDTEIYGTLLQSGGAVTLTSAFVYGLVSTSNSVADSPDFLRIEPSGEYDQTGGTNNVGSFPLSATYRLTNGVFTASWMYMGFYGPGYGRFYQSGGATTISNSVRAAGDSGLWVYGGTFNAPRLDLGLYNYYDSSGHLSPPYYGWGGNYYQYGGTATIGSIQMAGGYRENGGGADFELHGGTLSASLYCPDGSNRLNQYGGTFNAGYLGLAGWTIEYWGIFAPVSYTLSGGVLNSTIEDLYLTYFTQTGGTNHAASFSLSGSGPVYWSQYGSQYFFSGGSLIANDIDCVDRAIFYWSGPAKSGRIRNDRSFRLNGTVLTYGESEQLGRLILTTRDSVPVGDPYGDQPSMLDLGTNGPVVISFANSSAETWDTNALLQIIGWHGSIKGGGRSQVFFGNDSTGLAPTQLAQIRIFVGSGSDVPPGSYPAKILSTGEIVPFVDRVFVNRSATTTTLSWYGDFTLQTAADIGGPYVDVPNAESPYDFLMSGDPQRFFRLRSNP